MRAVILCGGRGTRAWPSTAVLPKPLLEVGGQPILRHVMDIYARQGVTDFVLAAGYLRAAVDTFAAALPPQWQVDVLDTGEEADTGDRVLACLERAGEEFFLTYGDGIGDIDLSALLETHRSNAAGVTVTVVPLPSQYGTLAVAPDGQVTEFREKPVLADHLINAGFFVVRRAALDTRVRGSLERDILPDLSRRGELFVYRHHGFWRSMDTHKDVAELDGLARTGEAPWLV